MKRLCLVAMVACLAGCAAGFTPYIRFDGVPPGLEIGVRVNGAVATQPTTQAK